MGRQSLATKIRELIGSISWKVFLWASNLTEEQYHKIRDQDALRQLDTAPIAEIKVDDEERLWVRLDNYLPEQMGSIRLLHEPTNLKE